MTNKGQKLVAGLAAFSIILTTTVTSVKAESYTSSASKRLRLGGKDRYETAAHVSQNGWKSSDYVILANGDNFADALCAAPLAKKLNAPILLTQKSNLNESAKEEIKRLNVKHVVIIGLDGAVSQEAEQEIKAIGADVKRIGGKDRYETSIMVAKEVGIHGKVVLASGDNFADALSIAPIAASEKMPILLTAKDTLPDKVAGYINENKKNITKTYVIGETGAVSSAVVEKVGTTAVRIGGNSRFDTNAEVLKNFSEDLNFKNIYVALGDGASGNEFADALSGTALAVKTSSPVVLVYDELSPKTEELLKSQVSPKKNVIALGGQAAVSDSIIEKISSMEVPTVAFSADGQVKSSKDVTKDNVSIDGKNVTLKDANVSGNVYLYGNGAALSNVKVAGTIYVDPGENGSVSLDNVQANKIRVRSGAQNSIRLKDVNAGKMIVESDNESNSVRIVSTGSTKINNTIVSSYAILDLSGGSLGTVNIVENGLQGKVVELKGTFNEPVIVDGSAVVKVAARTYISTIKVQSEATVNVDSSASVGKLDITASSDEKVTLAGRIKCVEVKSSTNLEISAGANIDKIDIAKNASGVTINVPKNSTVGAVIGEGSKNVSLTGDGAKYVKIGEEPTPSTPSSGGSSGGSGGSSSGGHEKPSIKTKYYKLKLSYGELSYDMNLGEEKTAGEKTIEQLYDENVKDMTQGSSVYSLVDTIINKSLEKTSTKYVGGVDLNKYAGNILVKKNSNSTIGKVLLSSNPNGNDEITKYLQGKSFNDLYDMVMNITGGDVAIPQVKFGQNGQALKNITITKEYKPGQKLQIEEIQSELGINRSTKLKELRGINKENLITAELDNHTSYTVKASNGTFTLKTPSEKVFTISVFLEEK